MWNGSMLIIYLKHCHFPKLLLAAAQAVDTPACSTHEGWWVPRRLGAKDLR